ncbi:four helix bundle protein [Dyella humi]|uniref:Four helix bundle protein n=1 Tax=Dyella humi TaxID=1770547 RepID=A0ABW8IMK3_9GAMM
MASNYRELRVWQDAMSLAELVYAMTWQFPVEERFGLSGQLRRAVVSVASCIAEGNARGSTKDYMRFLSMSAGSLAEVETQTLLARRLGYISEVDIVKPLSAIHSLMCQIQALKNALVRKQQSSCSPFPVPRSRQ